MIYSNRFTTRLIQAKEEWFWLAEDCASFVRWQGRAWRDNLEYAPRAAAEWLDDITRAPRAQLRQAVETHSLLYDLVSFIATRWRGG